MQRTTEIVIVLAALTAACSQGRLAKVTGGDTGPGDTGDWIVDAAGAVDGGDPDVGRGRDGGGSAPTDTASSPDTLPRDGAANGGGTDVQDTGSAGSDAAADSGSGSKSGCGTPGQSVTHRINFQPRGARTPSGWRTDVGWPYDAARGWGWGRDISSATRQRGIQGDPLLDTAIFAGEPGRTDTWRLDVPPGTYLISLRSGDPLTEQGPNRIVAEGEVLLGGKMSAKGQFLAVDNRRVEVCDGQLTLEVGDGTNDTALNWIDVRSTDQKPPQCTPSPETCNNKDDDCDNQVDEDGVCKPKPKPGCVISSLQSAQAIRQAGYTRRGGNFRDGGWAVDRTGHQLRQRLSGDYSSGSVAFEAKGLFHRVPLDPNNHGCERFIFNINYQSSQGKSRTRMWFASMEDGCAGRPRGNLRIGLLDGNCCNDSRRLPARDDGQWHRYRVSWTPSRIKLTIDGQTWVDGSSGGADVGSNIDFLFGSENVSGDQTNAVFRNLEICKGP